VLKNVAIEGCILDLEQIYNGMGLTSMAGYPLTFQQNPFRLDNVIVSTNSSNKHYKNGVVHTLQEYPNPFVPWRGKSILDVLQETNNERKGDLSDFIADIAITPDIQVLHEADSITATTLFVPTNDALAEWNLTLMEQGQEYSTTTIEQMVQNHIVNGNFVQSDWQMIPTGTQLSNKELRLTSFTGHSLDLLIDDDIVTINGDVMILQKDIFSENGMIHIINKVF
jgi:Fasciclin domain